MKLLFIASAFMAACSAVSVTFPGATYAKKYMLFYGTDSLSEPNARLKCASLGAKLSDIGSIPEFQFMVQQFKKVPSVQKAFVNSWQGDAYGQACIAFYNGGAIVEPPEGCAGKLPFLCEFN